MYKKIVLWCLLLGVVFVYSKTYAADGDIQWTYVGSCQQGEDITKTIFIEWGQEKEICIQFTTISEEPVNVAYGFVNKDLGGDGNPVCAVELNPNDVFNKIFINEGNMKITVTKDAPGIIKKNIRVPIWANGTVAGCITYTTEKLYATWIGWMLNLVVRKVLPINLFVGSGGSIKNSIEIVNNPWGAYSTNAKVQATVDASNNLNLGFLIKNNGNIGQDIAITGKISNFFGFEKEFSIEKTINPWDTVNVWANAWLLPGYKWFFTIIYNINNTPKFDFDASSIDGKYKQWGYVSGKAQIYIFSWITLIIIIAVLLIIIKFFWPKKKQQQIKQ